MSDLVIRLTWRLHTQLLSPQSLTIFLHSLTDDDVRRVLLFDELPHSGLVHPEGEPSLLLGEVDGALALVVLDTRLVPVQNLKQSVQVSVRRGAGLV